jgi:A/G-specific adenine glycosylase
MINHSTLIQQLPWSITPKNAYKIWVSEIMLQQTQVQTVIPYFQKFIEKFPDIRTLAQASQDQVLQYWAGLGYYARARNMHRAAQIIEMDWAGIFPNQLEKILELPGIGRSTAGAIYSFAFNQPAAILDGNVKRVLVRLFGISEWPDLPKIKKQLWDLADDLVERLKQQAPNRAGDYTQAMMDLGALICTSKNPKCHQCPIQINCQAFQTHHKIYRLVVRT